MKKANMLNKKNILALAVTGTFIFAAPLSAKSVSDCSINFCFLRTLA